MYSARCCAVGKEKPNMLGYLEIYDGVCGPGSWAHQDSNLGPSDYESDALTN